MKEKSIIKTSVIIPIYNTKQYLEECIDSVFRQTQKEIEVIAINDGSTDGSLEVLMRLKKKYSDLIIITQENHGQGYARNVGIERIRGEYIFFLDSDDYILDDTLEICYECASRNKLDVVLFDAFEFEDSIERTPIKLNNCDRHKIVTERKEIFSGTFFLEKYYQKSYNPADCLIYYSTSFMKKNDIRFLENVYFEDNELYCRVMTLAERVMYIPKMFYQYRCRKDSTTGSQFDLRKAHDHIKVISAMADLRTLNGGRSWQVIREISLGLLQYVAVMCKDNALYDVDSKLPEQIMDTWAKICGDTIESTKSIENIEYIYRLCRLFPDSDFREMKRLIDDRRKQMLIQELGRLPLRQRGSKIAIYGCGKYTDKVLDFYEQWVGRIKADIIFLDSYVKDSNTMYRNCQVYSVNEIGDMEIDNILISSPRYEGEMRDTILKLYGNQFTTIMLHGDLHINV